MQQTYEPRLLCGAPAVWLHQYADRATCSALCLLPPFPAQGQCGTIYGDQAHVAVLGSFLLFESSLLSNPLFLPPSCFVAKCTYLYTTWVLLASTHCVRLFCVARSGRCSAWLASASCVRCSTQTCRVGVTVCIAPQPLLCHVFGCLHDMPHQADQLSYNTRAIICAGLMVASFLIVGYGKSLGVQLFGVACCSMQVRLGLPMYHDARCFHTRKDRLNQHSLLPHCDCIGQYTCAA